MVMSFSSNSTNFSSLRRTSDSWCLALWQQPDFNHSGTCRGHTSWKLSSECGLMAIILEMVATSYSLCKNFLMPCTFLVPSHILILPLPPVSLWSAPSIEILIFKIKFWYNGYHQGIWNLFSFLSLVYPVIRIPWRIHLISLVLSFLLYKMELLCGLYK